MAQRVTNPTGIHEDAGLIPGLDRGGGGGGGGVRGRGGHELPLGSNMHPGAGVLGVV